MNIRTLLTAPYRHLYFLQLEGYNLPRYFKLLPTVYTSTPIRASLVWTLKLRVLVGLSVILAIILLIQASSFGVIGVAVGFVFSYVFFCVYIVASVYMTLPFEFIVRMWITSRALRVLKRNPTLITIAIAGSYGKTTMKEVLGTVIRSKKRTVVTPHSFNTPLGIARTILNEVKPDTEVFVVEMGEHYPGDLAELTKLVPPDMTIITGVNEAHLERFKTFDALIETIFESVTGTKTNGLVILNADSDVLANRKNPGQGRLTTYYSSHNSALTSFKSSDVHFHIDGTGNTFTLKKGDTNLGEISVQLLGEYAVGISEVCFIVGEKLGMSAREIVTSLKEAKPVPHRLEPIKTPNALVIDDSYNGNPEGVRYAIQTLARFENRRKIYVTPGLVEAGDKADLIHQNIGKELASVADVVVLIRNTVTPSIKKGLDSAGYKGEMHWFDSALQAHASMQGIVKSGDVVLFQNDWPDNYI